MKTALVVPSIRENNIQQFLKHWCSTGERWNQVIVVEDNPTKTFDLKNFNCDHVSWKEIKEDLKSNSWIISKKDSAIRCYGFLKAYREGADFIFTMDDDCFSVKPETKLNSFVRQHLENLNNTPKWTESVLGYRTRGIPYKNLGKMENVMLSVGLWEGNPDFDAVQTLSGQNENIQLSETRVLPSGQFVPICGMNLSFKKEIASLMYFPLQGEGYPYRRFDDIWMGVICKKICDHLRFAITCGRPYVNHSKASCGFENLIKEAPGLKFHEKFWEIIDRIPLLKNNPKSCMAEIGYALQKEDDSYLSKLGFAIEIWASFFN